jgi:hypothetical protein
MANQGNLDIFFEALKDEIEKATPEELRKELEELLTYRTHNEQEKAVIQEIAYRIREKLGMNITTEETINKYEGFNEELKAIMEADIQVSIELAKQLRSITPEEYFEREAVNKAKFRRQMKELKKKYNLPY